MLSPLPCGPREKPWAQGFPQVQILENQSGSAEQLILGSA